ncbi:MAG: hypothetical protein H6706_08655 [Myxococcales bacterium]|nr:hypothetical protein [Myxococcales bacterium]
MRHLLLLACASLMALPAVGCGDDPPPQAPRRRRAAAAAPASTAGAVVADEARLPKKLRGLTAADWAAVPDLAKRLRDARDPFRPYVEDLVVVDRPPEIMPDEQRLETKIQEPPANLKLIAIITGTAVHRAMVNDSNGLGHVIRPGDMVGDEIPYRVARITRNEVLFQPIQPPTAEKKLEDVRKALLTQEELEEQLP